MHAYEMKLEQSPYPGALDLQITVSGPFVWDGASTPITPGCVCIEELEAQVAGIKEKLDEAVRSARRQYSAFDRKRKAGKVHLFDES
jgi:hypothetical protein